MEEIRTVQVPTPAWASGSQPDERKFAQEFRLRYDLIYVDGLFYTPDGVMPEDQVRKHIYDWLHPYYSSGISKKTNALLDVLKMECHRKELELREALIHLANGTYNVNAD